MITRAPEQPAAPGPTFHDEGHGYDVFGLHPPTLRRAVELAAPLYDRYFRVGSTGIAHVPLTGPVILVANHGGALAVDAALLAIDVARRTERTLRTVGDRFIPYLPFVSTLLARAGVVNGARANVRRLLERGELIAIFPEGSEGIGKPAHDRYQLRPWRVGFAELAIRHRATIVPVAIIGSEESWPVVARLRWLHPFGAPFLPIPYSPVPLPVRFDLHYGVPIDLHAGLPPAAADDPEIVERGASRIRAALAALIASGRDQRRGTP